MNERQRILKMVKEGKITIEEAEALLEVLPVNATSEETKTDTAKKKKKKNLAVDIDAKSNEESKAKVKIKLPLPLIKTLLPVIKGNLPKDVKEQLNNKGIDIDQIVDATEELFDELDATEENIVDIEAGDEGERATVKIYVD